MMLSASKVLGAANGGKAAIGINLGGTRFNMEFGTPTGKAPPKRDPGIGLPGGVNALVRRGRVGLKNKAIAAISAAIINVTPMVFAIGNSESFLDG